ncbi:EAL domain-containing protein [Catenovulum agarivorans]|uniref:EAL domain-containing protein n=1 Tax=Catenovulum agarivorans TaxID=1172192 RepID=UPI00031F2FB5|nr:EAL domain-containing protein [Catenovulum agarivorans]
MQWIKAKVFHSLSVKATLAVLLSCLSLGMIGGFLLSNDQNSHLNHSAHEETRQIALLQADLLNQHLSHLLSLGALSHQQVSQSIEDFYAAYQQNAQVVVGNRQPAIAEANTAIYYADKSKLNETDEALANHLNATWTRVAQPLADKFNSYYFISQRHFAVTYPAKLATELPSNHDFDKDIFYKLGTPHFNPTRQPLWTPVYFDDIHNSWMTTLVYPIYLQGQFIGVVGADFILENIMELVAQNVNSLRGQEVFIFDNKGNLIFHPEFNRVVTSQQAELNTQLNNFQNAPNFSQKIIREALVNGRFRGEKVFMVDHQFPVAVGNIAPLSWYLAVVDVSDSVNQYLSSYNKKLYLGFAAAAVAFALLIYFLINQTILKRLKIVTQALSQHKQGQIDLGELLDEQDEIGVVARSINSLSGEVHSLIDGLNEKIKEKEVAELAAVKLSNAVKHSETAIAITNDKFEIEFVNPKFVEMCGREEDELIGHHLKIVFDQHMAWMLDAAFEQLQLGHAWKGELLMVHSNATEIWVSQTFSPMTEDVNGGKHFVSATQDISMMKDNQREMEKLAYHDPLTDLYNRTFFKAQLTKSLEMTKRGHFAFALFYFDLDQFKRVNDTLGHEAGDELLIEIARRLVRRLRAEDTIARLGGDEFAVILSGVATVERASAMATDIQNVIREPVQLSGAEVLVSASIGITMSPKDAMSIETLLRNADLAMYRAKAAGRSTHYFFTDDLDKAVQESLLIESELRVALREFQFQLFYQPQIDLKTGKLFGFEALIRWNHPERGMVSPAIFIPVAEQSGLIVEMGEWVLAEASMFIARLNQKYNENYTVAVNLSARQFKDKSVAKVIKGSIINARIKPEWLDIEITESMLMGDINEALHQLDDIKALGVQMSIDDFGTGYSSLSYLKKFPVDTLKVDRAFIKDIPDDTDDMAISDAIIAMAHKLNMKVIAEGVETAEHVQFLIQNHCQIGQGYLFSQPIDEESLYKFIDSENKSYMHLFEKQGVKAG